MSMTNTQIMNSVNDYLREMAQKKPLTPEIILQFKSISDLLPYLNLLQRFPKLKKLSLHGNRIKQLPTDLSVLENIEQLDITNNLLDDNVEMTIISLKTLPKLKKLQYQVRKDKEARIMQQVKTLEYLNNTRVIREKAKVEYEFKTANQKSLWEFEEIIVGHFSRLLDFQKKYLGQNAQVDAQEKFRTELSQISRECIQKLTMSKERATQSLEYLMLSMTKFDMFEMLKARSLNICMDIYSDLGKFLKLVFQEQDKLFKQVSEMTLSLARIQLDQKEKEEEERYNNEFQSQHSIVNKNAIMQKELKRMRKQKDELIGQISQLETHNKKISDLLVKMTKGENLGPQNATILQTFQSLNSQKQKEPINIMESVRTVGVSKLSGLDKLSKIQRQPNPNFINTNYNSTKTLSLKQLKEVIDQIYESKLKFDEKNYQGKLARETMNQYLFTYLNQKYGLKSLTLQAANNIVSGIQEYSSKDNDVAVFGKILRNQVDQQFRFVQSELKTTINDLLKMHIKSKMPYKSVNEINDMLHKKTSGQISYEECEDLIRYLYNKNDSTEILRKIEVAFIERQKKDTSTHRRRPTAENTVTASRGKIEFSIFLQNVLNFQLKNHQKLLRPLINSFKKRDRDSDGIIGEQQFVGVIEDLCEQPGNLIPELLQIVDPYETKAITFTQMVKLVANYPQDNPILNRYAQKNANEEYHVQQG